MINLVRNELIKIFSKKSIYIYTIIVLTLLVGVSVLMKDSNVGQEEIDADYVEYLESSLSDYDLTNEHEASMFIGDKVLVDIYRLSYKYNYDSPEKYYIDTFIQPLVKQKYISEYINKDLDESKNIQLEIDRLVKRLDNFDAKQVVREDKVTVEKEIKEIEDLLLLDSKNEELISSLEELKIKLWCLNYRIDNDIPYSYDSKSIVVDDYENYYFLYKNVVHDESLIKDRDELFSKREIESNYKVSLYKLENNLLDVNYDMINYVISSFAYVDGFIICAIIIIAGALISEEFNKGTIKQLLTKPYGRGKILTSKIIASLIAIALFIFVYELVFLVANCYEYGDFSSIFANNVIFDFSVGKVREVSVIWQCLYGLLSVLPAYLIIFLVVLLVGIISTSSVAAIVAGFGVFLGGDLVSMVLKQELLAKMPFVTWDLSYHMYGGLHPNKYVTFGSSILIDIVTIVLLVSMAYLIFNRKEVKNQ